MTIITSTGDNLTSQFDLRFGRCAYFCVLNEENGETKFIENTNVNASGGAGTKAVEMLAELDAKKVISGDFGAKAKDLLNKLKIQMVIIKKNNTDVKSIIDTIMLNN